MKLSWFSSASDNGLWLYDRTGFDETAITEGNAARTKNFDTILSMIKLFNDNTLLVPFFVFVLDQHVSSGSKFGEWSCVSVVTCCNSFVAACKFNLPLRGGKHPVPVEVVVGRMRWYTILQVPVEENLCRA